MHCHLFMSNIFEDSCCQLFPSFPVSSLVPWCPSWRVQIINEAKHRWNSILKYRKPSFHPADAGLTSLMGGLVHFYPPLGYFLAQHGWKRCWWNAWSHPSCCNADVNAQTWTRHMGYLERVSSIPLPCSFIWKPHCERNPAVSNLNYLKLPRPTFQFWTGHFIWFTLWCAAEVWNNKNKQGQGSRAGGGAGGCAS